MRTPGESRAVTNGEWVNAGPFATPRDGRLFLVVLPPSEPENAWSWSLYELGLVGGSDIPIEAGLASGKDEAMDRGRAAMNRRRSFWDSVLDGLDA